ncbi:hypothetical protein VOLCADRAFT_105092 [Volvox carteri f. nagariensis]|uniref:Sulfotransferase n=1 Tax=Volvox carteri f. nagariensis TaxID=3068 RepID=D8TYD2_VOLCA|nr:uncharacterized protein VOLCADRAFT_105092 [Volvox carteri f. nagariensis]EFJ47532.1 hypothetical protein VOLCADRAFT_105092 [Volvox carteri f. nagariensis]|eukprot:XP_002951356.1 hypothetical protein VOLCADRAFT_105092 [Volvox carteri f. nagariensis]
MRYIKQNALLTLHLTISLGVVTSVDVNGLFSSWLCPPAFAGSGDSSSSVCLDPELQQSLDTFLFIQTQRELDRLLNAKPEDFGTGLLAGILTTASGLLDAEGEGAFTKGLTALEELLALLPEEPHIWPLARRVTIASLALRYGKQGPFGSRTEAAKVHSVLLRLYDHFKQSARRKGVVEFTHVSKSGGTSFCQLAKTNGCNTEDFGYHNCLIEEFDDKPRYFDPDVHRQLSVTKTRTVKKTHCNEPFKNIRYRAMEVSCTDRRTRLLELGYTLYANEYTALGGTEDPALAHPCRNMVTVLEIRHPYSRVISHIKHGWFTYGWKCKADREKVYFRGGHNASQWNALMPAATNNYLIRSLLGEAVFNLPLGAITREHLDLARNFLAEQYDVVLVLEDKPLFAHTLKYGLGWAISERHANSRPDNEESNGGLPADLDSLLGHNSLDVELYQFGVVVARLDGIMYGAAAAMEAGGGDRALLMSRSRTVSGGDGGNNAPLATAAPKSRQKRYSSSSSRGVQISFRGMVMNIGGSGVRGGRTDVPASVEGAAASRDRLGRLGVVAMSRVTPDDNMGRTADVDL